MSRRSFVGLLVIALGLMAPAGRASHESKKVRVATWSTSYGPHSPEISGDGRYVGYWTLEADVPEDTNGVHDVYVYDRRTKVKQRVSVATGGAQSAVEETEFSLAFSDDGRLVAFASRKPDLVPGDMNATTDVFLHDRLTGETSRVSTGLAGLEADGHSGQPSLSANGRYVAFSSTASNLVVGDTNATGDVFIRDRQLGTTTRVSIASGGTQGNGSSSAPSISADGSAVAFTSIASNFIPDDLNAVWDVFVRNVGAARTTRVSIGPDGEEITDDCELGSGPGVISGDGRIVAFLFYNCGNDIVLYHDLRSGKTYDVPEPTARASRSQSIPLIACGEDAMESSPSLSYSGRYLAYANSNPCEHDYVVYDRIRGQGVAVDRLGEHADGNAIDISGNGRIIAYLQTSGPDGLNDLWAAARFSWCGNGYDDAQSGLAGAVHDVEPFAAPASGELNMVGCTLDEFRL